MDNELKGTKLGESKSAELYPGDNKKSYSSNDNPINMSLRGTLMGEESDFEKKLKASVEEATPKIEEKKVITQQIEVKKPAEADETESVPKLEAQFAVKQEEMVEPKPKKIEIKATNEEKSENDKNGKPADLYGMALKNYAVGDIIKGIILSIEKAGLFVDINYKCEGFVANEELSSEIPKSALKVGDTIYLSILQLETKEGYTLLSVKRAEWELSWKEAYQSYKLKETVEVTVVNAVKGGLVVNYKGLKGFIPSSLVNRDKNDSLNTLINKKMDACFVEVDKKRKKIIFSNKLSDKKDSRPANDPFETLEVGQVVKGKVTSIKDFGAFVNINGIEGLIHISELSWDRIDKVEDVLKVGDIIDVFVLGVDKENKKVSLGIKQLTPDPWEKVEEIYPIGSTVNGTISRITSFGAFVKLEHGLEGLIHISELSHKHVKNVEDVVQINQKIQVKVIRIIPEEQKIGLSLKQMLEEDEEEYYENAEVEAADEAEEIEEPAEDLEILDNVSEDKNEENLEEDSQENSTEDEK
ncbi:MAG: S1 RNA-binding domain-containing protein [Candidatus Margulisbacteria bacterium]|nr:S1 RNA-binding domain-containing protein [Candidatus Margulisiibacteriota bacterium]